MRTIRFRFLLFLCFSALQAYTTHEIILHTAMLMDTLHELLDTEDQWPNFKEQRNYLEHTCTSASCIEMQKNIAQCRVIFDTCSHKLASHEGIKLLTATLLSLEEALQHVSVPTKAIIHAGRLPQLNLDSGVISINGASELDVNGNLVVTGTTTNNSDMSILGNLAIGGTLVAGSAYGLVVNGNAQIMGNEVVNGNEIIGGTLTVGNNALFSGTVTYPGENATLNAVGSYPDSLLRIVAGTVNTSTLATTGGGFTAIKNSVGTVTITFTQPFSSAPIITATSVNSLNSTYIVTVTTNTATISRTKDGILNFIAIGQ